ncbi:unnamed protein product [Aureobasidium pullulans]|nr:unnamed protein product [Aureobasidium pullulans]CAC9893835.1 unnamed protein product [Aureobasidium pullulans]
MRKALRLGDGDEVSYRSKAQRVAMQSILYNDQMTPLVVVLPTGGGKSLLFMAPACLENAGVTIVIVPFRALINKLVSTAKEAGVNSTEWHPGLTDPATLVFVSADRIIGSGFLSYAELLHSKGLLRRVFVDECHLTFTASDWRPKLVAVRYVRGLRVPLIMLTATLPPMLAFELEVSMACQTVTRYIRATTTRLRTRYVVETCRRGELEETTIGTCKRMQKHIGRNKGVIYCRSIDQCKDMAKELGCAYYHGGSIDNEDKLAVWMETGGLIVATSALGTGVDFPGIVFILHMDLPYGMIDYAQESGRAGRAGEEVDSIIIVEQGKVESMRQAGRIRGLDEEIMAEFVTTRECRRQVMSRYLDGKIVECGAGDVAQCDRCGEGLGALERLHEKNGKERETVEKTLDDLTDGCASCWMLAVTQNRGHEGNNDLWTHSAQDCTIRQLNDSGLRLSEDECNKFRQAIRYEKSTHSCHKCGISQRLCNTRQDGQSACQWPNVAIPLLRGVIGMRNGMIVLQHLGFTGTQGDWAAYAKWLGLRHRRRIWDEVMSNAMATLIELIVGSTARGLRPLQQHIPDVEENYNAADIVAENSSREEEEAEEELDDVGDERTEESEDSRVQERLRMRVLQSKQTSGLEKVQEFARKLEKWIVCCPICKAADEREERDHGWDKCEKYSASIGDLKFWLRGMETIRPYRHSGKNNGRECCCLPEQVCREGEIEGRCRWEGVVGRVALCLLFCGPTEVQAWVNSDSRFVGIRRERQDKGLERGEDGVLDSLAEFLLVEEEWKGVRERRSIGSNVMCELVWIFG